MVLIVNTAFGFPAYKPLYGYNSGAYLTLEIGNLSDTTIYFPMESVYARPSARPYRVSGRKREESVKVDFHCRVTFTSVRT